MKVWVNFLQEGLAKKSQIKLLTPFLQVYAGDIYNLSKECVLGELADYEHKYGSLLKGFIKTLKQRNTPLVFSFTDGLQTLTDALTEAIQPNVIHESVQDITYTDDGVTIFTNSGIKDCSKSNFNHPILQSS